MLKKIFILLVVSVIIIPQLWTQETDSIVIQKLNDFTDTIINNFDIGTHTAIVAVADFDNKSDKAAESNIGFTVADIISQRLSKLDNIGIVESSQIQKIIENMQLGLTGLYNEKTVASLGHLVGAEYMVIGSVTDISGFYRINVRVVKIETGVTIVNEILELDSILLEKESEKYLPPRYRVFIGTTYAYSPQNFNLDFKMWYNYINFGLTAGFNYDIKKNHSLSLFLNYFPVQLETRYYYTWSNITYPQYNESFKAQLMFHSEIMLGYGYKIKIRSR